jgi:transcriptional regulator with XRE-family HTH domain
METVNRRQARSMHRDRLRAIGMELRHMREDSGRSQTAIAQVAGISQAHLSEIEAGTAEPGLEILGLVAAALGADLAVRVFPQSGPRVRDRVQLAMEEALLVARHARWLAKAEVPVYRPIRGVIDLVLHDRTGPDTVASEVHSRLLRVEQQARWARQKADALAGLPESEGRRVCRLLVLRNCRAMRELVGAVPAVFAAAYPGRSEEAVAALTGPGERFPDAAIAWVDVDGGRTRLLAGPPRGIGVGR